MFLWMLGGRRGPNTLARVVDAVCADFGRDRPATVAIIARHPKRVAELGTSRLAATGVGVLELVGLDHEAMHDELGTYAGTGLVVVDARASYGERQQRTFRRLSFHLSAGDLWVALRSEPRPDRKEGLVRLAQRWEEGAPGGPDLDREPTRSIRRAQVSEQWVAFEKSRAHLLKVRDHGATDLLNLREPDLSVSEIATLPAGTLVPSGSMTDYPETPETAFPGKVSYPQAHLRRYDGRVALPGSSVVIHGRSILPDSFRWHLTSHPLNRGVRSINARFANPKPRRPTEHLPGAYYFFGYNNPGHFGHLMTEAFPKLWGWDAAKAEDPDLKLLCREHPRKPGTVARRLEHALLPAYGIDPDDVAWATSPVTVDRLVGATPLWHNAPPYYAHPALRDEWRRLRSGHPAAALPETPKIFVSRRRGGNRFCRNTDDVERLFSRHGFVIVRPEWLSIPEQAALFAQARAVAGFGGSGMFNLLYAESLENLIVLNQSQYWGRSEHLFAAVLGVDSHFFWSEPDPLHDPGSYEAHQADWEFDFARLEGPLVDLLTAV
jgi:capsular polysaccharide biosynthesis protein